MKSSLNKKAERKTVSIREHQYAPEQRMPYQDAMALVRKFRREGQYPKGQYVLEQVCRQVKFLPEPQLYLMNIYLDAMNIDDAQVLVGQLLKSFPRDTSVLSNCANFYIRIFDTDTAFALLDRAAAVEPRNDRIHVVRARAWLSLGNPAQAHACYLAALRLNPHNVTAMAGGITPCDNPLEQPQVRAILALLENGQLPDMARAELHFALARAFSRADKDAHFQHLQQGNDIVTRLRPYRGQQERSQIDKIVASYQTITPALQGCVSGETLAPIFIAAMPRSGTTMLEQMLGCHSRLHPVGESAAFSNALRRVPGLAIGISLHHGLSTPGDLSARLGQVASGFHENYFVRSAGERRLVDKSIDNVYHLGNILTVFPMARVIDLRRHPLGIIYSCYQQFFSSTHNYAFDLTQLAQRYSNYRRLMDYWGKLFPQNILPVSYETLVEKPEPVLRQVLDFCGLQWEPACLEFHQHNSNVVNTASLEQVRRPLYTSAVRDWEAVAGHLAPAARELGELVDYTPVGL